MPRFRLKPVLAGLAVVALAALAITVLNLVNRPLDIRTASSIAEVAAAPGSADRIPIDTTVYYPQHTPASAVLVSPGFGGDKDSVADQSRELAQRGFVALAYSPRGFGRSGGQIGLNSPDLEVADASALVSRLAADPAVREDKPGDPRVGVAGGSYGGALALILAGIDHRVDAVAAAITYNDLGTALLPNDAAPTVNASGPAPSTGSGDGVFKRSWAGNLFALGFQGAGAQLGDCGRFTAQICKAYTEVATTGKASKATLDLLRHNSPASVTGRIKAPTLLIQGERDSLFGFDQAQANASQIAAAGTKVKLAWYNGGHDGQLPGTQTRAQMADWLAYQLDHTGTDPGSGFSYVVPGALRTNGAATETTVSAPGYPGLEAPAVRRTGIGLSGTDQLVSNPPGGAPSAISNLPGVGAGLGSVASRLSVDIPGQFAEFTSAPVSSQLLVAGASTVDLTVSGPAVLFAKLYDVGPDGTKTLPGSTVSPLRVNGPGRITVTLPGIVSPIQHGHRLALVVSTTDSSYASPAQPYSVRISLAGNKSIQVPTIPGNTSTGTFPTAQVIGIGVILALAVLAGLIALLRRRRADDVDAGAVDIPISLRGLTKVYGGKLTVVSELSFDVRPGQVVGLLGPNGAGKTTALRMMMGLVRPTAGQARVFGQLVRPGAPVLSRIGAFVERSGFLPHLSGRVNLELFWQATGRPASESNIDSALEIADLGPAEHRRVGTYSQGMRQRLAIAQAMLGLPELLVLDEPTNGLDPPQIHHMRTVLRDYAATGRTVLVSSHLLAEVEQTCTHVVVMHKGKLVAEGPVEDVVSGGGEATFAVDAPVRAAEVLRELPGVTEVHTVAEDDSDSEWSGDGEVHATLDGLPRSAAVRALVSADVGVHRAGPRRRLEDAFLQLVGAETSAGRPPDPRSLPAERDTPPEGS